MSPTEGQGTSSLHSLGTQTPLTLEPFSSCTLFTSEQNESVPSGDWLMHSLSVLHLINSFQSSASVPK